MHELTKPLDEKRNVFTDMLLSPAAFDLIAQITMTWTNEKVHRQLTEDTRKGFKVSHKSLGGP